MTFKINRHYGEVNQTTTKAGCGVYSCSSSNQEADAEKQSIPGQAGLP